MLGDMVTLTRLYPLLKQIGVADQASQEFIESLEGDLLEQVANKTDLEKVKAELKSDSEKGNNDLENVNAELSVKIESSKADLLRWLFGAWGTQFLAILAVFLKFP